MVIVRNRKGTGGGLADCPTDLFLVKVPSIFYVDCPIVPNCAQCPSVTGQEWKWTCLQHRQRAKFHPSCTTNSTLTWQIPKTWHCGWKTDDWKCASLQHGPILLLHWLPNKLTRQIPETWPFSWTRPTNENVQVCNTVYEEVCEAAQPTYAGGRGGGAGGASGGYGAAKAPACRRVPSLPSFLHSITFLVWGQSCLDPYWYRYLDASRKEMFIP